MDFIPRHRQPFTLQQAIGLNIAEITEGTQTKTALYMPFILAQFAEIDRLQNSLAHLRKTQDELRDALSSDPDPVFKEAIEENEEVMYAFFLEYKFPFLVLMLYYRGSQEERIRMLRMALSHKGASDGTNGHYGIEPPSRKSETTLSSTRPPPSAAVTTANPSGEESIEHEEDGVYL